MAWEQTGPGKRANDGWYSVQRLLMLWLPQHRQSLIHLSRRSIRG